MYDRIFYPSRPDDTTVRYWVWSRSFGVRVVFKDGMESQSDWSLHELLRADRSFGDGLPIRENKPHTERSQK